MAIKVQEKILSLLKGKRDRKELQNYLQKGFELIKNKQVPYKRWIKDLEKYIHGLENRDEMDILKQHSAKVMAGTVEDYHILLLLGLISATFDEHKQLSKEIVQLTDSHDEVLGFITHEFKNILTSIHGYNMMMEKHLTAQKNDDLYRPLMSSDRLTRQLFDMVDSLLKMFMGEKGLLEPEFKLIDFVGDIVNPVKSDIEEQLLKKNMRLIIEDSTTGSMLEGDEGLLDIVMRNLLMNAVKYGKEKTDIMIKILNTEEDLIVSVQNVCDPLPKDLCKDIFQKFRSRKIGSAKGGTGIGLYNAKNIVNLHKGDISCCVSPASTIEFKFNLPQRRLFAKK
jgi:signal transduction histidine kinase